MGEMHKYIAATYYIRSTSISYQKTKALFVITICYLLFLGVSDYTIHTVLAVISGVLTYLNQYLICSAYSWYIRPWLEASVSTESGFEPAFPSGLPSALLVRFPRFEPVL